MRKLKKYLRVEVPFYFLLLYNLINYIFRWWHFRYELSSESVSWVKFVDKARYVLHCRLNSQANKIFYVVLVVELISAKTLFATEYNDKVHLIHICPPMMLQNLLPFPIKLTSPVGTHFYSLSFLDAAGRGTQSGEGHSYCIIYSFTYWLMYFWQWSSTKAHQFSFSWILVDCRVWDLFSPVSTFSSVMNTPFLSDTESHNCS